MSRISSILKQPKQVFFFNPIKYIFDIFLHTLLFTVFIILLFFSFNITTFLLLTGYIKSVVAKDKDGEIILDPVLPLELTARCRIQEVSEMRQLHIKGLQCGFSGYQIAQTLSSIITPHCNAGPIADMNGEVGSISSKGRCVLWFPDHTTAQAAFDAINNNEDINDEIGNTRIRAYWGQPKRRPTEMEIQFRKSKKKLSTHEHTLFFYFFWSPIFFF